MAKSFIMFVVLLGMGVVLVMWGTFFPKLTRITVSLEDLPPSLEGFTVLHITDLHGARFGENQGRVFDLLKDERVDMVAFTGDLVDSRQKKTGPGLELIDRAASLGPVFFVPGNHEFNSGLWGSLRSALLQRGVKILDNGKGVKLKSGQSFVIVAGVSPGGELVEDYRFSKNERGPVIVLSHYPRLFGRLAEKGADLVLAGHTHGGQIRLPWVGAIWVPGQGKFPYYDAGLFQEGESYLYINRGLGTTVLPVRFLCRAEVALITLTGK